MARPAKFHEVQRFTTPLMIAIIGGLLICGLIILGKLWLMYSELGLTAAESAELHGELILALLIGVGVPVLLMVGAFFLRLETVVTDEGLRVQFKPFTKRVIQWSDIESSAARDYRPIREYGGWGWRRSARYGSAYNVSGSRGVQLHLSSGEKLLIGSNEANRLARAIQSRLDVR